MRTPAGRQHEEFSRVIHTLLFDLGNVLVHFSHEKMCTQIGLLCGRSGAEVRTLLFDSGLQWEFERGQVSEREFHGRLERLVGSPLDFDALRLAGSDIFDLNPPMPSLLDQLRARGHRLVLLSNTSITHYDFVERRFHFLEKFDDAVLSFRVGAIKPEPAIFAAALKAIQCPPSECFYTDDIPAYVEAGRSFGLNAEVFTDAASLVRQLGARGIPLEVPAT